MVIRKFIFMFIPVFSAIGGMLMAYTIYSHQHMWWILGLSLIGACEREIMNKIIEEEDKNN